MLVHLDIFEAQSTKYSEAIIIRNKVKRMEEATDSMYLY